MKIAFGIVIVIALYFVSVTYFGQEGTHIAKEQQEKAQALVNSVKNK